MGSGYGYSCVNGFWLWLSMCKWVSGYGYSCVNGYRLWLFMRKWVVVMVIHM